MMTTLRGGFRLVCHGTGIIAFAVAMASVIWYADQSAGTQISQLVRRSVTWYADHSAGGKEALEASHKALRALIQEA